MGRVAAGRQDRLERMGRLRWRRRHRGPGAPPMASGRAFTHSSNLFQESVAAACLACRASRHAAGLMPSSLRKLP